eukprot:350392-Chlamydomonas_euryale.AAC.1
MRLLMRTRSAGPAAFEDVENRSCGGSAQTRNRSSKCWICWMSMAIRHGGACAGMSLCANCPIMSSAYITCMGRCANATGRARPPTPSDPMEHICMTYGACVPSLGAGGAGQEVAGNMIPVYHVPGKF